MAEGPSRSVSGIGDQERGAGGREEQGSAELPGLLEASSGAFCGGGLGADCPLGGVGREGGLLHMNSSMPASDTATPSAHTGQPGGL